MRLKFLAKLMKITILFNFNLFFCLSKYSNCRLPAVVTMKIIQMYLFIFKAFYYRKLASNLIKGEIKKKQVLCEEILLILTNYKQF